MTKATSSRPDSSQKSTSRPSFPEPPTSDRDSTKSADSTADSEASAANSAADSAASETASETASTANSTAASTSDSAPESPSTASKASKTETAEGMGGSLTSEELERVDHLSYEEARDELIQTVRDLEAGNCDINTALHQWELGNALARRAQSILNEVYKKLDETQQKQAGRAANAGVDG